MKVLDQAEGEGWFAYNCDAVEFAAGLPSDAIDFSVYSPPFSSLYIYSESERDMGNVASHEEFFAAYRHLIREKFRATKPGRVTAVHCSDLPRTKQSHGVVGLYDFPADVRAAHESEGWIYYGKVTIWKDPVVEMTRTKALGLLYKTLRTDATRCRPGMPDYLLIFRKPIGEVDGKTPDPVTHDPDDYPVSWWQEAASPVWMTINQTNVLNVQSARTEKDEKHLCPLQLDVIQRALFLYSNPAETVWSPFMGVGSEGVVSLRHGRRFVGTELKPEYFAQAVRNLSSAEVSTGDLFAAAVEAAE